MNKMTGQNNAHDKRAFTMKEAAEYACVSRAVIENWLTKGLLPCEELPGRCDNKYRFRRIRKKDIDDFLDKFYYPENVVEGVDSDRKSILKPRNA